jgi:hypothetical protein
MNAINIANISKIIIEVGLIFGVAEYILSEILSYFGWKRMTRMSLKCPNCNFIFKPPQFRRSIFSFLFFSGFAWLFLSSTTATCPNCKRGSWCKMIEDKDIQKETVSVIKPEELPSIKGYHPSIGFKFFLGFTFFVTVLFILTQLFLNK